MQGYAKRRSYIFVYTWPWINGCGLSVLRYLVVNARESAPYESRQLLGESALKCSGPLDLAVARRTQDKGMASIMQPTKRADLSERLLHA